jgi:hypothetical protein
MNYTNLDYAKLKGFNINTLNPSGIQFRSNPNIIPTNGAISRSEALDLMKKSKNIDEWNANRNFIRRNVGAQEYLNCGYFLDIDVSGLIKTLKLEKKVKSPAVKLNIN